MALYSGPIKIRYLEAEQHNQNYRTTFKLPNNVIALPNLRIANLGLFGGVGSYSKTGVSGLIKHIYLYSDSNLIDQLRNLNQWDSFRQMTQSNKLNKNIERYLSKVDIGYEIDEKMQGEISFSQNAISVAQDEKNYGYLELMKYLQILAVENFVIDTAKMPNLRIEIEWETSKFKYLHTGTNNNYLVARPVLIYDEVSDQSAASQLSSNLGNLNFVCIENDSFHVPEKTPPSVQSIKVSLKGFNQKFVNKFLVMKSYNVLSKANDTGSNSIIGKGFYRSPVQFNEKVNILVNGEQLYETKANDQSINDQRTAHSWGSLNVNVNENLFSNGLANPVDGLLNKVAVASDQNLLGMASYLGCKIQNKIEDLRIEYDRSCPSDNQAFKRYSEGLDVHVFGEVQKQMIFGKNSFVSRYL